MLEMALQSNMIISLGGRTALMTGASRGIGRAIALALAGANVTVHYNRDTAAAASVVDEIKALSRRASIYQATLEHADTIPALVQAVASDVGGLDTFQGKRR